MHPLKRSFCIIALLLFFYKPAISAEPLSFLPEQKEFKSALVSSPNAFIQFHISDYRHASQLKAEILIATRNKEAVLHAPYKEWIVIRNREGDKESANIYIPLFAHTAQFGWNWKEIRFKKVHEVPFAFVISDVRFVPEVKFPTTAEPVPLTYQDFEDPLFNLKKVLIFGKGDTAFIRNGRGTALKINSSKENGETLFFIPFVKALDCSQKTVTVEFWSKAKKFGASLASLETLTALQTFKKNKLDLELFFFEDAWRSQSLVCSQQKNILGLFIELPKNSELLLDQIKSRESETPITEF